MFRTEHLDMPAYARRLRGGVYIWGVVLLMVLAFKALYSSVPTSQLQWLLWPLATLLNSVSSLTFTPTPSGEWLDADHNLIIVKACAGGNFLIASWLGYLWRWRDRLGPLIALKAFGAAWLTTLVANAIRILLIAHGQNDLALHTGLSAADSHRLIGIIVYFGILSLQLAGAGALVTASAIYLGITLLLPWLNALWSGRSGIDTDAAAWTAAIPLLAMFGYGLWRLIKSFGRPQVRTRGRTTRLDAMQNHRHESAQ